MLLDRRHPGPQRLNGRRRPAPPAAVVAAGRAAVAAIVAAVAVLGAAAPTGAHNSRTAFTGVFGPYDVVASVRYAHEDERGVLLDLQVRFVGAAGLAALFGWLTDAFLTSDIASALPRTLARAIPPASE